MQWFEVLKRRLEQGEVSLEVLLLDPGTSSGVAGQRWILDPRGAPLWGGDFSYDGSSQAARLGPERRQLYQKDPETEAELYWERWAPPPRLVVYGGGHIGRAITEKVDGLGFRVLVVEDREYFLNPDRFPATVETYRSALGAAAEALALGPEDFVVIATRGHTEDLAVLRSVLPFRPFYLGLLGSRRKLREFRGFLEAEVGQDLGLDGVRCPVGLDLGAETPAEIAVAVAAQLVQVRSGRG